MNDADEDADEDRVCGCVRRVGNEGGSCTERTLSVRAAEDPLSDISSRACAIEVASTADIPMTQQG